MYLKTNGGVTRRRVPSSTPYSIKISNFSEHLPSRIIKLSRRSPRSVKYKYERRRSFETEFFFCPTFERNTTRNIPHIISYTTIVVDYTRNDVGFRINIRTPSVRRAVYIRVNTITLSKLYGGNIYSREKRRYALDILQARHYRLPEKDK